MVNKKCLIREYNDDLGDLNIFVTPLTIMICHGNYENEIFNR